MAKKTNKDQGELTLTVEYQKPKTFWRVLATILIIWFLTSLATSLFVYFKAKKYLKSFTEAAQVSQQDLNQTLNNVVYSLENLYQHPEQALQQQNFLILGGDQLTGRDGDPVLTDTIVLLQLDLVNSQVKSLALPRDLYHEAYQTKINALYYYGLARNPEQPLDFPQEVISELTGVDIDYTLLINIEDLEGLIDLLGGVELDIPVAFSDPRFPREGVDVSQETDPEILYQTVSFEAGQQLLTGRQALQYMRSRHSDDEQGTDLARSSRQQLVLAALMERLTDWQSWLTKPQLSGQLYRFYLDHFAQQLPPEKLAEIMFSYLISWQDQQGNDPFKLEFSSLVIPIYPDDNNGLIVNPPLWQSAYDWRYQIRDLDNFQQHVQDFFTLEPVTN